MPDWRRIVQNRLAGAGFEGPVESEISDELAFHLERRYAQLTAAGMPDTDARAAVLDEIDGRDWIEAARSLRRSRPASIVIGEPSRKRGIMSVLFHDFKVAWRAMIARPAFSLMVIGMLALGIAGNAAIFSLFNGLFLRPFPFPHPERLADVDETAPQWNLEFTGVSNFDQDLWRKSTQAFEGIAFFTGGGGNMSGEGAVQRVRGAQVTWNLLDVLGLKPALGRTFTEADDKPGTPDILMVSNRLWQSAFQADRGIVGRVLKINERPYTVVGVLPPEAVLPDQADVWSPLRPDLTQGSGWYLSGIGRLRPGVTVQQAQADLQRIHQNAAAIPRFNHIPGITSPTIRPLRDRYLGSVRTAGRVLLVAVGAVLLIACVNIAALMLVRGAARAREIAIRTAVGASRGRIVAQLMSESLLMAGLAGIVGVLAGAGLLKAATPLMPANLPRWVTFEFDWRFALFCLAITGTATVLFALLPAIQASGVPARAAMQEGGRTWGSRRHTFTLRALVVVEVALALAVLVAAGLVLQGFRAVSRVDPGFRAEGVLTFTVSLPAARYPNDKPQLRLGFFDRLITELRALPGVQSAAATTAPPLGGHWGNFFEAEGARKLGPNEKNPVVLQVVVTPGYLGLLGIKQLGGRDYTDADEGNKVNIVNESFVRQYWPDVKQPGEAVGRRIRNGSDSPWRTIVGVVGDEKHYGMDEPMKPAVYLAYRDVTRNTMTLVMRTGGEPETLTAPAREVLRRLDPELPMFDVRILGNRVRESLWVRRGSAWLFTAFAAVALLLAGAGIYGVVSYTVSRRRHEIGIRMALGARPERVLGEVIRGGMAIVAVGAVLGIAAAWLASRLLGTLLFGVSPRDPVIYVVVALGILLVGLMANLVPARRAASLDPMRVLRSD
jgi:predicted permease